jgi:prephenate dehydratase
MSRPLRVAIQGDRASFHEIAAQQYYTQPIQLIYCQSFNDVFELLASNHADTALVATSNSTHGIINEVARLISNHSVSMVGEYHLPIHQHLIGLPGAKLGDASSVVSHPVALSQCRNFLKRHSQLKHVVWHDTAAAVQYVKETGDPMIVAIGSAAAAELHGLPIITKAIQDDPNNVTVFSELMRRR